MSITSYFKIKEKDFDSSKYIKLDLENSKVIYFPKIFTNNESLDHYKKLEKIPEWEQRDIMVFNKKCKQNRYTSFFAKDPTLNYRYSGTTNKGSIFTPNIIAIKTTIETIIKDALGETYDFNYCLLNYYLDGNQSIGMHSDDEKDMKKPIIASVSLGAERFFNFQHKTKKNIKERLTLKNGSLIIMMDQTQKFYKHGVPIQKTITSGRINLTFRCV